MASGNERAKKGRLPERRLRRSGRLADALRLQLEALREEGGLVAIVVSDELGFCVAHSGGDGNHEELAARLPILASAAQRGASGDESGGLHPPGAVLSVTTFTAATIISASPFPACSGTRAPVRSSASARPCAK